LSNEFKKKVADLYLKRREKLEEIDPDTLESFASEVLAMIEEETKHDPPKARLCSAQGLSAEHR
jgi:hypothetical protein